MVLDKHLYDSSSMKGCLAALPETSLFDPGGKLPFRIPTTASSLMPSPPSGPFLVAKEIGHGSESRWRLSTG